MSRSKFGQDYEYISDQEDDHRRHACEDELVSLLQCDEIEYDERYVWT